MRPPRVPERPASCSAPPRRRSAGQSSPSTSTVTPDGQERGAGLGPRRRRPVRRRHRREVLYTFTTPVGPRAPVVQQRRQLRATDHSGGSTPRSPAGAPARFTLPRRRSPPRRAAPLARPGRESGNGQILRAGSGSSASGTAQGARRRSAAAARAARSVRRKRVQQAPTPLQDLRALPAPRHKLVISIRKPKTIGAYTASRFGRQGPAADRPLPGPGQEEALPLLPLTRHICTDRANR